MLVLAGWRPPCAAEPAEEPAGSQGALAAPLCLLRLPRLARPSSVRHFEAVAVRGGAESPHAALPLRLRGPRGPFSTQRILGSPVDRAGHFARFTVLTNDHILSSK